MFIGDTFSLGMQLSIDIDIAVSGVIVTRGGVPEDLMTIRNRDLEPSIQREKGVTETLIYGN